MGIQLIPPPNYKVVGNATADDLLIDKTATVLDADGKPYVITGINDGSGGTTIEGDALPSDILEGKTATTPQGVITGTLPNRGAATLTPSGSADVAVPDGNYTGAKVSRVVFPANMVRTGITIAGVPGTMPNNGSVLHTITTQGGSYQPPEGYHSGQGFINADFPNLVAGNVKSGVNIGGVVGTLQAGGNATVTITGATTTATVGETTIPIITFPIGTKYVSFMSRVNNGSVYTFLRSFSTDIIVALKFGYGSSNIQFLDFGVVSGNYKNIVGFSIDMRNPSTTIRQIFYQTASGGPVMLESQAYPSSSFAQNLTVANSLQVYVSAASAYSYSYPIDGVISYS